MFEIVEEGGRTAHRCRCNGCGWEGPTEETAAEAAAGFHEYERRWHLCQDCFVERGRPWVLWYELVTVEQRREALQNLVDLRGNPGVQNVHARDLIRAIRDRRLYGIVIVTFREGAAPDERWPAHVRYSWPSLPRTRPTLAQMGVAARTMSPPGYGFLRADLERIRGAIAEELRMRLPEVGFQLARDFDTSPPPQPDPDARQRIISQYLSTPEGRRRLTESMVAPLRARMDYQSIARRTFQVEALPPGATPIYERPVPPPWPSWAVEGVTVYHRVEGYQAYIVSEVRDDSLKLSEVGTTEDFQLHRLYHSPGDPVLDREWCEAVPMSSWERLLEDE